MALVGRGHRRVLGIDRRVLRGPLRRRRRARPRPTGGCPARSGSRARAARYAEHIFAGKRRRRGRDPARLGAASELASWSWGELRAQTARDRRRPAGARRRRGRPRRRVHAEHPRDGRGAPGLRVDRRDLVLGGARVRRAQRDRPLRQIEPKVLLAIDGYRYGGKDFDRSRDRGADRRRDAAGCEGRPLRLPRRQRLGGRLPRPARRRALVHAAAVRPPAVGALQLRDDRAAEADRPRARAGSCSSS